jgi:hypothetical protein
MNFLPREEFSDLPEHLFYSSNRYLPRPKIIIPFEDTFLIGDGFNPRLFITQVLSSEISSYLTGAWEYEKQRYENNRALEELARLRPNKSTSDFDFDLDLPPLSFEL